MWRTNSAQRVLNRHSICPVKFKCGLGTSYGLEKCNGGVRTANLPITVPVLLDMKEGCAEEKLLNWTFFLFQVCSLTFQDLLPVSIVLSFLLDYDSHSSQ